MLSTALSPSDYLATLPQDRKQPMETLRKVLLDNLPLGFEEVMSSGMISYVVPHTLYPTGYHCNTKQPLPFISIASQKNFVALYHMGLYADVTLVNWFTEAYKLHSVTKPDMGKSCLRFKKPEQIPFALIAELAAKLTPNQWIRLYEAQLQPRK